jgi:hypothetical protein
LGGDSTLSLRVNRNKKSFGANPLEGNDIEKRKKLRSKAERITQNFRTGVK